MADIGCLNTWQCSESAEPAEDVGFGPRKSQEMNTDKLRRSVLAALAALLLLPSSHARAQQSPAPAAESAAPADDIADFFSQVGDQIYEDCIFELSEEQLEVQQALIEAYIKHGAPSTVARQLAVKQIQPPQLSERCEQIKWMPKSTPMAVPPAPKKPKLDTARPKAPREPPAHMTVLAQKKVLPLWDCPAGVDYVTIKHKGYDRKLTGGEICNPFDDVVRPVPDSLASFRLGYTIRTGRLFVMAEGSPHNGRTIAWAISGREACRNNPDPDCLAARAIGPLPPGEYSFASDKDQRVSWGPRSQRMVAGIFLTKLWDRDRYTPAQTAAILARGNIAIHVRLKGEMSEACLGLEPKGWAYVSSLIKDGRATGVSVYVDEPHPQIAEAPPINKMSSFSLSSLFKMTP
jgi:hypothetical protein